VKVLDIVSHSEEQTAALARRLSSSFVSRDVVVLKGSLGSGKTTFVRALVGARGIDENLVRSPSFAFLHEYRGNPPVYHFDLYRLQKPSELFELGWDEYLNRYGVMFVEWGEKAAELLPERYYLIEFAILSDTERQIHIRLVQP
jgi:tRNA threonylcarbamoyladenosine biosynthesis protein TsaE